jgi:predicted RNase H-like HicB family nuclease
MKYAVVIEKGPTSFGATVPDLPGCFAVADSREEVERLIREAIVEHVALLRAQGQPVPEPSSSATEVEVPLTKN